MCKIRLLVIGDSISHNLEMIKTVKDKISAYQNGNIQLVPQSIGSYYAKDVSLENYDLAIVDEIVIAKNCCQLILGSRIPILTFGEIANGILTCQSGVLDSVVDEVVSRNLLGDYIVKITEEIETTHKRISAFA